MQNHVKKAKKIIAENLYCVIASADLDGRPWVSPVFFNFDKDYNIYWESFKDSTHSKLIRKNPRVAIVIFDSRVPEGTGDGIYLHGVAKELKGVELKHGIKSFFGG